MLGGSQGARALNEVLPAALAMLHADVQLEVRHQAGERNLARCWSALTDGHAEVARTSLATSISYFELAREAWDRAEAA